MKLLILSASATLLLNGCATPPPVADMSEAALRMEHHRINRDGLGIGKRDDEIEAELIRRGVATDEEISHARKGDRTAGWAEIVAETVQSVIFAF